VGDTLHLNLSGRVLMVTSRYGITDLSRITVFVRALVEVIDHFHPTGRPSLVSLESLICEQLALLENALQRAQADAILFSDSFSPPPEEESPADEQSETEEQPAARRNRQPKLNAESAVMVKSKEEKLRDEREPVQKLLREDCVHSGLLDKKKAEALIRSMLGKEPRQAEQDIVEMLRQILQDQVKAAIRRKSGPWTTPQAQEDMRKDIHNTRSVKSVLMLARQVHKEMQDWKKQNGKGGLLGLFG